MKLTVDCVLTAELARLKSDSALSLLLAKGSLTQVAQPLEALICEPFGLKQDCDFPIAAVCASVDGLDVGGAYWLRADLVHFAMQRDCFSLNEPVPILLEPAHARQVLASLNQHFVQDGLTFCIGQSGTWYLHTSQVQRIKTTFPSVAVDKNVHHFMPEGPDSARWKAILNEVQMILHEHSANIEREASGHLAVNSVWFSGGGVLPSAISIKNNVDLIVAHSPLYQGLAKQAGIAYQVTTDLVELLKNSATHTHLQLPASKHLDGDWFQPLVQASKAGKIKQLTLNLGFYDKCLVLEITPLNLFKFWQKSKPVAHYLA